MHKVEKLPQVDGELGWLETAPESNVRLGARVKGDQEFDIAIIGAGFTGLSVALRFAEINPSARIAVVDALRVGEGSSGRNAGFLIDLPHNVDFSKTGVEHARSEHRLNMFGIERLRGFKDRYSIPFWNDAGKFMAAHEQSNLKGLDNFASMLQQAGFEYELVSGSDLNRRLGTDYYRSAVYTRGNVLVNPAALVRGLVKALPASVSLFESSPVQAIEYGPPHKLQFLGGSISAPIVVQATNSYSEQFGKLTHRIAPIFTYASLTQPLSDDQIRRYFGGVKPWGLTSAHQAGTTVRFTDDRRIFIRNTYDILSDLKATREKLELAWHQHRLSFEARFPFVKEMTFEYTWGGVFALTLNHEPIFKNAGEGVYVLGGCNGVGVVKGTYLGYYMADYISGIDSENLRFVQQHSNPSWIPPEPLLSIGGKHRLTRELGTAKGDV
ncbi:NAD(P)/FAD-dependent oxidoreductase [Trinickia dinghuensis]|uniref:FAD-binding oxidoreductase n=1 Tax=Trinickia dinghuensis TaxID=2291023 RepID=A0A3D8JSX7_9BURK|nr:FAD-binding oxidoreductase [Trinickia dinghuensis]RDU95776.1 FAD-binding oxidoreductase [Trinickia dinghuensis]